MRYRFKTKPYEHQVQGIRFAFRQFGQGLGAAFLFEPRTGKSKTTIDTLAILYHKAGVRRVVIIAPNRVLGTWVQEIHTHCPLSVQTIIWDARARKTPLPRDLGPYDMQAVIVNFEAFATPGRRTPSGRRSRASGRFKHRTMLRKWISNEPAACVVDEGHKIKSPSGKAANAIVSMVPDFQFRLLLTGTPITKARRAHDIFMLWQWVNPDRFQEWGYTVDAFKNHIGKWIHDNGFPQWVGPRKEGMRDLRRGIHADGMVVRRDDCFDLPPRETRIVPVKLTTTTRRHYDEMAADMVTQIREGVIAEAAIPLVVTLRLQQLTSGFVSVPEQRGNKVVSVPHRVGSEKLAALADILTEEVIEREEKVVVAAKFKVDLDRIAKLCDRLSLPLWVIRGGLSRADTDDAIRAFRGHQDGPACMLVQPDAASLGIDLSTADHMIWYSLTQSWVNWTQTCDRIALSRTSTTFTYLTVPGSVDSLIYGALQDDTDVSRAILRRPESIMLRK